MRKDMKRLIHRIFGYGAAGVVCCLLAACSDPVDENAVESPELSDGKHRVSLLPEIRSSEQAASVGEHHLAAGMMLHGGSFSPGEEIGFFSKGGNMVDGESTDFNNLKLMFNGRTFDSEELNSTADAQRMTRIFSYCPYTEGMGDPNTGADIYAKKENGDYDEPLRVIDFLTTNYSGGGAQMATQNTFKHTFCIVRVTLGKGFESFEGDIYLQLERKVKAVYIDMDTEDMPYTQSGITCAAMHLLYEDTAISEKDRRLQTFDNGQTGDLKSWDVIVPCRPVEWYGWEDLSWCGVSVEAIVLVPNGEGQEIKIPVDNYTAFIYTEPSGNQLHGIRGGYIFTVCIKKEGFDATVFPVDVQTWNEGAIKEDIPQGITDEGEYVEFVSKYNSLFNEEKEYSEDDIKRNVANLTEWGDSVNGVFTVFFTNDIDLSKNTGDLHINNLVIPIDGRGKTIKNGYMEHSFCETMQAGGSLKDLYFENLRVVDTVSEATGLLVGTMNEGTIDGCRVSGGWIEGKKVGAAVGTMKNGNVKNCRFGGIMLGEPDTDHKSLVGIYENGNLDDSNRNNMVVRTNKE